MSRKKKKLGKNAKLAVTRSEAHTFMELPATLRAIVRGYVRDTDRRRRALADPGIPEQLREKYRSINEKIDEATEMLDPVMRQIFLVDICNKRGYDKSAARDYMARPTYYRQKNRLETEIARQLELI